MTTTSAHSTSISVSAGARVELGRYATPQGERILYGQRVDGVVRVTDRPASGHGRSYLVERGLERDGHAALKALVDDYLSQATMHRQVPMAENVVGRYLEFVS
jgi:hypothetical protein